MANNRPPEHRIALCLITGDEWRNEEVTRMASSVRDHVDGVFVNFNGKSRKRSVNPERAWRDRFGLPMVVERFEWEDDFAKARQQSFEMVPREEYGWYLWLDTDDVLVVEKPFDELFRSMDEYTRGWHMRYEYGIEPKTGAVIVEQWRERLLSTQVEWRWLFPVHEVARSPFGTQWGSYDSAWVRHLRTSGEDRGARERNRRIIAAARKEHPEEPRFLYYMANETLAEAETTEPGMRKVMRAHMGIELYRQFLSVSPVSDDFYNAQLRIAELHEMVGENNEALDAFLQAIKVYPSWPDGYIGCARVYMSVGDWHNMRVFADLATRQGKPQTAAAIENQHSGFIPIFLRGLAHENLGDIEAALADYREARDHWNPPPDQTGNMPLEEKIAELEERLMTEGVKPVLLNGWKTGHDLLRVNTRGTKKERSICFFTNPGPEPWHPLYDAERGSGGAERLIMELAPQFAADGWRVAVFGRPGEHRGVHEGVEYWRADEWVAAEPFTVFVGSRAPNAFEGEINAKAKLLWLHDVSIPQIAMGMVRPDAYVCLSEWHRQHTSRLYGIDADRISVVPNGMFTDRALRLTADVEREPHRFVWSSSYDRGLDTLLGLWPTVREMWDDAEVYVHYGWDLIDAVTEGIPHHPLRVFKARCMAMHQAIGGDDAGFHMVGRVPKEELWRAQAASAAWLYPTSFMETFCITAVEAQLLGAIPVTSRLAALEETVWHGVKLVDGWPKNVTYQNQWLENLRTVVESYGMAEMRQLLLGHAMQYDWDNVYARWRNLIDEVTDRELSAQFVVSA